MIYFSQEIEKYTASFCQICLELCIQKHP